MSLPVDLKYTKDHEWVKVDGSSCRMGITEFAQDELGELVYVELPKVGVVVAKGASFCVVESTKAASDVYAPVSGKVIEVNLALNDSPSMVNSQPYEGGWLVKLELTHSEELSALLSADEYRAHIKA
jgi:glycine cleavage system H protein